jgi:hypothetical protein
VFGILVNGVTLYALYRLLLSTNRNSAFAATCTLLIAFSPSFWDLGFQNQPYPLAFLAIVIYLLVWNTNEGDPLSNARLALAGLSLAGAVFFQQAAVLLVPPAALILTTHGKHPLRQSTIRSAVWSACVTAIVLGVYVFLWRVPGEQQGFWEWSTAYLQSVHPTQLRQMGFLKSFARSVMGLSGALLQSDPIEAFLGARLSAKAIFALYGALGLLTISTIAFVLWWTSSSRRVLELTRHNAMFAISLVSVLLWWAFCFAWEPVTPHYWVLGLFPLLACVGLLFRGSQQRPMWLFGTGVILLCGWNGIFNYKFDRIHSRNFPQPLLNAIDQHVGKKDIFIVLGHDQSYGGMDYNLLFRCLKYLPRNPGLAILNDYVIPANDAPGWQTSLRDRLNATINSGGRVYVAAHIFDSSSYDDFSEKDDPFSEQINEQYLSIDGAKVYQEVRKVFEPYNRLPSNFSIGPDRYFILQRK